MIRFAALRARVPNPSRAFDFLTAGLVLIALIAVARHLAPRPQEPLIGLASVIDGDSLRVDGAELRLAGLDAPELHQTCMMGDRPYPCGQDARRELVRLTAGTPLTCEVDGHDRYGRRLARCRMGVQDVGALLVQRGLAVAYGRYTAEEAQARQHKAGIWAGTFQRPADWRKEHPRPFDPGLR